MKFSPSSQWDQNFVKIELLHASYWNEKKFGEELKCNEMKEIQNPENRLLMVQEYDVSAILTVFSWKYFWMISGKNNIQGKKSKNFVTDNHVLSDESKNYLNNGELFIDNYVNVKQKLIFYVSIYYIKLILTLFYSFANF